MTERERELIVSALAAWAEKYPEIERVIVYGSRARGDHQADSDLDVAIELRPAGWDESAFVTWMASAAAWRRELQATLSWVLDLQWHDPDGETETVSKKIETGHFVAYSRICADRASRS